MTSEPANVLIAVICLATLILAGGFTQAMVPVNGDLQFELNQGGGIECPEDRLIRPCADFGSGLSSDTWRVQLIEPFLEDLIQVNDSTPPESNTPTPESERSGTESSTTPTKTDSLGANATPAGGEGGGSSTQTEANIANDTRAGTGLGRDIDWLLWPLLAVIGGMIAAGIALSLRDGPIEGPRDLLAVPKYARDVLLSLLVGVSTRFGSWLLAKWSGVIGLVKGAFSSTPETADRQIGREVLSLTGILYGLRRLPVLIVRRIVGDKWGDASTDGVSEATSGAASSVSPPTGEFDIIQAWTWLAGRTTSDRQRIRTPEDIARDAVDQGFPREAVYDLLAAFRDVTYGGFEASGSRLQTAREAYEMLRETEQPSAGGSD